MSTFIAVRNVYILVIFLLGIINYFFVEFPAYYYLLPTLVFICLIAVGSADIKRNFYTKAENSLLTADKVVALTFDDGPSEYTPAVLELLDQYKAKGTFFCIGKNIEKHEGIAKKIYEKGHVIGNHSYSHSNFFPFFRKNKVIKEINRTNALLQKTTGAACILFRPPFGVTNPAIAKAINACGMKTIGWNIRSFDTSTKNPDKVIKRVISRIKPGAVILLHDNRPNTLKILEAILLYTQENNYQCVAFPQS